MWSLIGGFFVVVMFRENIIMGVDIEFADYYDRIVF